MHVYLDESGTFTERDSKYFTVGSFTVGNPQRIINAFRRWQRTKFPRKIKVQSEVKFNDSHIKDELRLKTLKFLAKQDIRIFCTFLNKKNIPIEFRKKGKVYETGLLYTEIVVSTLELYLPITETEFRVIRDQRSLKGVSPAVFNKTIKTSLLPKLPAKTNLQVQAIDSTSNPLVQVADWVCGALARYHEGKPRGQEFYNVLKGNIIQQKELFSDYWTKIWEKEK